jgi:hypothetical protein
VGFQQVQPVPLAVPHQPEPGGALPQGAGDADGVAHPGVAALDEQPAGRVPQQGDGDDDLAAPGYVAADDGHIELLAALLHAGVEALEPLDLEAGHHAQADNRTAGHPAHGCNIADVDRYRLVAEVLGAGEGGVEMDVLNQQVGGEQDGAGRGAQNRSIVPDPDLTLCGLSDNRPEAVDQAELTNLG